MADVFEILNACLFFFFFLSWIINQKWNIADIHYLNTHSCLAGLEREKYKENRAIESLFIEQHAVKTVMVYSSGAARYHNSDVSQDAELLRLLFKYS